MEEKIIQFAINPNKNLIGLTNMGRVFIWREEKWNQDETQLLYIGNPTISSWPFYESHKSELAHENSQKYPITEKSVGQI